MKRWLLIKNEQYYPGSGTRDWADTYHNKDLKVAQSDAKKWEAKEAGNSAYIVDMWEWLDVKKDEATEDDDNE